MRNKFSRRDFLRASALTAAGLALATCKADEEKDAAEAPPAEAGPVTLEYWFCWSGRYQEIQRDICDKFEEEFDGEIMVHDLPVASNIRQKLLTAVAAGQAPDATACFGDLLSLAAQGAFAVIDEYVDASDVINLDDLWEARVGACKWLGKLYGFPFNCSAEVILLNVDMFEEAGLDPEAPIETWADFAEVSKKLVKFDDDGNLVRAAYTNWFPRHSALWFWINDGDAYQADTNTLTIDTPQNAEGLQTVIDYAWNVYGDIAKADDFLGGAGSAAESPFCVGQQATQYAGDWEPSTLNSYCPGVRMWPQLFPKGPKGKELVASNAGDFIGMLRGAPHPDQAYKFIEWMVVKGNLEWTKAGVDTNCIKSDAGVLRDDWTDIFGDRAVEVSKWWAEQMVKSRPVENAPFYGYMNDEIRRVFDLAFHKAMTAAEALQTAQANVLEEMDKYDIPTT